MSQMSGYPMYPLRVPSLVVSDDIDTSAAGPDQSV